MLRCCDLGRISLTYPEKKTQVGIREKRHPPGEIYCMARILFTTLSATHSDTRSGHLIAPQTIKVLPLHLTVFVVHFYSYRSLRG